jgi:hypothetical protein
MIHGSSKVTNPTSLRKHLVQAEARGFSAHSEADAAIEAEFCKLKVWQWRGQSAQFSSTD